MPSEPGKVRSFVVACCLSFSFIFSHAQSFNDHVQKADRFYFKKDYENALKIYQSALSLNGEDAQTNFKAGISCLHTERYSQAVSYLEKAYDMKPDVDPEIDYHLGMAYQQNHQFAKARKHFVDLKQKNKKLAGVATLKIHECLVADSIMKIPAIASVTILGREINTAFSEFSPLISADGNTLIFTSNRSTDEYQIKSRTNFEDVYISQRNDSRWSDPVKISEKINVKLNEAATSISADGKTLFLYYEDGGGDIYTSSLANGAWSKPVALNKFINHPQYRESSACISADGKRLFFASNRPGGKGGFDIYMSESGTNGQWGRPLNLNINTRRDEESPFLYADGKTLYFSSNGHATLGDRDIFRTVIVNGKCSAPENLGYPVNTSSYEGFFVLSSDGAKGYFTSRRPTGTGSADIYTVTLTSSTKVTEQLENSSVKNDQDGTGAAQVEGVVTLLKGLVIDANGEAPLEATISLVDNSTKELISSVESGPTGEFELVIPRGGNYGITTERKGYLFTSMNINLPAFEIYQELETHIPMVRAQVGSKVVLKNVFFDPNQSALKSESMAELHKVLELLTRNPGWRIQISGHTDNAGQPEVNRILSLKRAEAVMEYLVSQGISPSRLEAKGYGSEKPLVSNDDEREGRQINRRTEIEIIE
jgi:outer membrane protein OmpA-like peptidoglycan-associated protein